MVTAPLIERGCMFSAEHDASYEFWRSQESRWKICLAFNVTPPSITDEVHYFIATSQVSYFRENQQLADDVLIFQPNSYSFFPRETAIDFRDLCIVPFAKLQQRGFKALGKLGEADVKKCEEIIRSARVLENRAKRKLGLL